MVKRTGFLSGFEGKLTGNTVAKRAVFSNAGGYFRERVRKRPDIDKQQAMKRSTAFFFDIVNEYYNRDRSFIPFTPVQRRRCAGSLGATSPSTRSK
jgi:hypothetical protein